MAQQFEKVSLKEWNTKKPRHFTENTWAALYSNLILPVRKTKKSSGYDFHSPFDFNLNPGESILIPTGCKINMKDGEELLLFPRSGFGFTYFLRLANTIGKIDSDYYNNPANEGHIMVKLKNEGELFLSVQKGDSFCQGTIYNFVICEGDSFEEGNNREGGIGSTGT